MCLKTLLQTFKLVHFRIKNLAYLANVSKKDIFLFRIVQD